MNYRHAFHAGNWADCMKHALLVWLLGALQRKETAFAVLDTHAGIGRYALDGPEALRTGEWREGIGRLLDDPAPPEALSGWLEMVREAGAAQGAPHSYPGSPLLTAMMLRPQDRLTCCELQAEDHGSLRRALGPDPRIAVHRRDGYEAVGALLPPPDGIRRGLVLIDPPFEQPDEFARAAGALQRARRRFNTGIVAIWYPIKHRPPVRAFQLQVESLGVGEVVVAELLMRRPIDPTRLNGCGLLVAAPPFGFAPAATAILDALASRLGWMETEVSVRPLSAAAAA